MTAASQKLGEVQGVDTNRRLFLGFRAKSGLSAIRPPWSDNRTIVEGCTRCNRCIEACPETVLVRGDGGFPEFAPQLNDTECTFCKGCADACPEGLFDLSMTPPVAATVGISEEACLAAAGVHCECCRDSCGYLALRFRPRLGGPPVPVLDPDRCTACGACLGVCPKDAINLVTADPDKEAA